MKPETRIRVAADKEAAFVVPFRVELPERKSARVDIRRLSTTQTPARQIPLRVQFKLGLLARIPADKIPGGDPIHDLSIDIADAFLASDELRVLALGKLRTDAIRSLDDAALAMYQWRAAHERGHFVMTELVFSTPTLGRYDRLSTAGPRSSQYLDERWWSATPRNDTTLEVRFQNRSNNVYELQLQLETRPEQ